MCAGIQNMDQSKSKNVGSETWQNPILVTCTHFCQNYPLAHMIQICVQVAIFGLCVFQAHQLYFSNSKIQDGSQNFREPAFYPKYQDKRLKFCTQPPKPIIYPYLWDYENWRSMTSVMTSNVQFSAFLTSFIYKNYSIWIFFRF